MDRRTSGAARLGTKLLLPYLRFNIRNILKSFYPKKTDRADDWLINEMLRASYDPGVTYILESIFIFDLSLPLNFLLKGFENRILVIQGMKDPLYESKSKLAMFKKHCRGVVTKEIYAGSCLRKSDNIGSAVVLLLLQGSGWERSDSGTEERLSNQRNPPFGGSVFEY